MALVERSHVLNPKTIQDHADGYNLTIDLSRLNADSRERIVYSLKSALCELDK
jgi:hypothetical protein